MPATFSRRAFAALLAVAAATPAFAAAPERRAVALKLAAAVRTNYQDEAQARKLAAAIEARAKAGAYDTIADDVAFAKALTDDLRAVHADGHMAVMAGMGPGGADISADPVFCLRQNYGVQGIRRLGGNVGVIELNLFPTVRFGEALFSRYAAAMQLVADTRGLIVDIRQHMGGDPACVAYFCSYFFDRPAFVINRIRYRTRATEIFSTTASPEGRRYGETRPVLILTSRDSFSGAEEFAYDLQVAKRARIVGEVTGGGANPNDAFEIGGGLTALIPNGAAVNPVTGTNWEGVGVKPDVPVEASKALDVAHRLALEAALAQATTEGEKASIQSALGSLGA